MNKCIKTEGDANMISTLIAVIPLMSILVLAVMLFAQISIKQRAEWSLREFMLAMEVDGCLTPDNRVVLLDKLSRLGAYDVSLDGTTMDKKQYGEEIILKVRGKICLPVIKRGGGWPFQVENGFTEFSFQKKSTFLGGK